MFFTFGFVDMDTILFDEKFAHYCKYISNNSSLWQDLYQEFRIKVMTTFKKIQLTENPESYCRSIIYNLWRDSNGFRPSRKNSMTLANYADISYEVTDYHYNESPKDDFDVTPSLEFLLASDNKKIREQAKIFNEFVSGKNRLEISKQTGINYRLVHDAVRETAETIKHNMTKNEIKSALLAQGISSNYSGKTKTFFTNKKPSPDLEKSIIAVGFKIQTK